MHRISQPVSVNGPYNGSATSAFTRELERIIYQQSDLVRCIDSIDTSNIDTDNRAKNFLKEIKALFVRSTKQLTENYVQKMSAAVVNHFFQWDADGSPVLKSSYNGAYKYSVEYYLASTLFGNFTSPANSLTNSLADSPNPDDAIIDDFIQLPNASADDAESKQEDASTNERDTNTNETFDFLATLLVQCSNPELAEYETSEAPIVDISQLFTLLTRWIDGISAVDYKNYPSKLGQLCSNARLYTDVVEPNGPALYCYRVLGCLLLGCLIKKYYSEQYMKALIGGNNAISIVDNLLYRYSAVMSTRSHYDTIHREFTAAHTETARYNNTKQRDYREKNLSEFICRDSMIREMFIIHCIIKPRNILYNEVGKYEELLKSKINILSKQASDADLVKNDSSLNDTSLPGLDVYVFDNLARMNLASIQLSAIDRREPYETDNYEYMLANSF